MMGRASSNPGAIVIGAMIVGTVVAAFIVG